MKKHALNCSTCGLSMVKSTATEAKLRVKLIKWDRDGMHAVCKSCGNEMPIDIDLLKSIESRFVYEVDENSVAI